MAQANNAYIFPGLGFAVVACHIQRVTDSMFLAAAEALAAITSPAELSQDLVYPTISRMREVSLAVAEAVARIGYREALAASPEPAHLREYLRSALYDPIYPAHAGGAGSP